jgi:hypothetical protein
MGLLLWKAIGDIEMGYCSPTNVKSLRGIDPGDATYDALIAAGILYADAKIDAKLAENGEDIPLDSPPQAIQDISLYYTLGYITRKTMPQDQTPNYELTADAMLETYIKSKYKKPYFNLEPRNPEEATE